MHIRECVGEEVPAATTAATAASSWTSGARKSILPPQINHRGGLVVDFLAHENQTRTGTSAIANLCVVAVKRIGRTGAGAARHPTGAVIDANDLVQNEGPDRIGQGRCVLARQTRTTGRAPGAAIVGQAYRYDPDGLQTRGRRITPPPPPTPPIV